MTAAGSTPIAHASPFLGSPRATTVAAGTVQSAPIKALLQLQAMFFTASPCLARRRRRRLESIVRERR